jgi:ATP-dependent Lon protease
VWVDRESVAAGRGGALANDQILGNVTDEMKNALRNTFLSVREYARAKFPHLTGDILDYNYTFKVTKEDERSGGDSAGLPAALAFLSVFLQRPLPQDVASSGVIVADAHNVLSVRAVGEADYKVQAACLRNLRRIILPGQNRPGLEQNSLVPRAICADIVAYADDLDDAVKLCFGADVFL